MCPFIVLPGGADLTAVSYSAATVTFDQRWAARTFAHVLARRNDTRAAPHAYSRSKVYRFLFNDFRHRVKSAELGSSITEALRVYSDDMRHKRLSRAEEKAYSLPAKLAVPMMVCIFPVLFVVILLPVIVRLTLGNY